MKNLITEETIRFNEETEYQMVQIHGIYLLGSLLLNFEFTGLLKETQSFNIHLDPPTGDSMLTSFTFRKLSPGGIMLFGDNPHDLNKQIMFIRIEANAYTEIEIKVRVYEIDQDERDRIKKENSGF